MGSKEGIVNLSLAYLDRGDSAVVPDIGYPSYSMGARLAGGDICFIPVPEENGYQPDFAALGSEALPNAKLFWVNYPNNPTGATADLAFYQQAVQFCADRDILLVSDNPYVDVTFDGYVAGSALQADPQKQHTLEFISFSKTHNMAGWRLGAAVGNARAIANLLNIKSNMDSGHFHAIYDAGITALSTPQSWINERNAIYARRRDRILAALPDIGLSAQKPRGSLYVWAKVAQGDGAQYAEEVLIKTGVCLAPGAIYGPGGEKFVRFSTGIEDHRLDEALDRMRAWYQQR
jgi:LL-diaminopimelate aminotransferase